MRFKEEYKIVRSHRKWNDTDTLCLRRLLCYDSEEMRFLSIMERIEIQRQIAYKLSGGKGSIISPPLQLKLERKFEEIREWDEPEIKYKNDDNFKLIKTNKKEDI